MQRPGIAVFMQVLRGRFASTVSREGAVPIYFHSATALVRLLVLAAVTGADKSGPNCSRVSK